MTKTTTSDEDLAVEVLVRYGIGRGRARHLIDVAVAGGEAPLPFAWYVVNLGRDAR